MSLFCVYPIFHWGNLTEKSCQNWGVRKKYKTEDGHIGVAIEGGLRPSAHYDIQRLKGGTLESWTTGGDLIWKGRPQTPFHTKTFQIPTDIFLLNNRKAKARCKIFSQLTTKTPERLNPWTRFPKNISGWLLLAQLATFYTPWKHQKTFGFLMF